MFLRVNGCLSMLLGFRHEEASEMAIKKEDVESFIKLDRNDEYKTGLLLKDGRTEEVQIAATDLQKRNALYLQYGI